MSDITKEQAVEELEYLLNETDVFPFTNFGKTISKECIVYAVQSIKDYERLSEGIERAKAQIWDLEQKNKKLEMIEEIVKPQIHGQLRWLMAIQQIREICFGLETESDESGE